MVRVYKNENVNKMFIVLGILMFFSFFLSPVLGFLFLLALILSYYLYWRGEEEIQKTFSVCPLCGSNKLEGVFGLGIEDEVTCNTCGAEWKLFLDPLVGKLRWAKLITPGKYGGAELVGKKKPPDFWISLSKQRHPDLWRTASKTPDYSSFPKPSLDSIIRNINENIKEGNVAYEKENYTAATNLYFKALVGLCDYLLLKKHGTKPDNHKERFELLKSTDPALYRITRKFFGLYRKAYTENISKEECEELRDVVFSLIGSYSIPLSGGQRKDSKDNLAREEELKHESEEVKIRVSKEKVLLTNPESLITSVNDLKEGSRSPDTSEMSIQEVKKLLRELKSLYDEGLITEEDYEQKKKELLSKI